MLGNINTVIKPEIIYFTCFCGSIIQLLLVGYFKYFTMKKVEIQMNTQLMEYKYIAPKRICNQCQSILRYTVAEAAHERHDNFLCHGRR
jgi:hypothetical protein